MPLNGDSLAQSPSGHLWEAHRSFCDKPWLMPWLMPHKGLSHREFVPTNIPASILYGMGMESFTNSCLACLVNIA